MTALVTKAIAEARKIRKRLINTYGNLNGLQGWCGIASIRLASKLGSARSLRYGDWHVWNEVDGHIIDITATQFEPAIRGVLVYEAPASRSYHASVTLRGRAVIQRAISKFPVPDCGNCALCNAYKRALKPWLAA